MQNLTPAVPESLMERMNHHGLRLLWCYSTQCYLVINSKISGGYVAAESTHISGIERWVSEWAELEALDE